MVFKFSHYVFASCALLASIQASIGSNASSTLKIFSSNNATSTSLSISPSAIYPPPGLLASLSSMKIREDIYQRDLSKHAARADIEPAHTWTNPVSPATGVLASMRSIESVYRSLLLPPTQTILQTVFTSQTSPPTPPSVLSGPAPSITPPTLFAAPPLHVFISVSWLIVITFILLTTLSMISGGLGNALILIMLINLIFALHLQPSQVEAHADVQHAHHPHSMLHAARDPGRRAIGGLRPGPVGKIPCGQVKGVIGTKGGHFLEGVHRKIGGLKPDLPVDGVLMCDDWGNAVFGRAPPENGTSLSDDIEESETLMKDLAIIPTPAPDEKEEEEEEKVTTTIFGTTTSTLWVTVPDPSVTATTYRLTDGAPSSIGEVPQSTSASTSSDEASYFTATERAISDPLIDRSPFEKLYFGQTSSAVPPAVNFRTSFTYLLLLYLTGMLICLLLGGSSYALSFLLISFALAAIIAGAEGAAVPSKHYPPGMRFGVARPSILRTIGGAGLQGEHQSMNNTGSLEAAGLKESCGEVFCHNWSNISRSPSPLLSSPKPMPTYADLAKRLTTLTITVPPTSGVIQIDGPQIIPITVVSTSYLQTEAAMVTVDAVTEQITSTVVPPPMSTLWISPGTSRMSQPAEGGVKTVTTGETTITVNATLPSSTFLPPPPPPPTTETLWLTTTVTESPSSNSPSSSSSSAASSTSFSESSLATLEPSTPPTTSQASHLDPTKLYLSFAETNLYCFLFLFIGLQIALTTSHRLAFLGSMVALGLGGVMVLGK